MRRVFVIYRYYADGTAGVLLNSGRWVKPDDITNNARTFPTRAAAISYRRANFPGHWEMNIKPYFLTTKVTQHGQSNYR